MTCEVFYNFSKILAMQG